MKAVSGSALPILFNCAWPFRDDVSFADAEVLASKDDGELGTALHEVAACVVKDGVLPDIERVAAKYPTVVASELQAHASVAVDDLLIIRQFGPLAEPAYAYNPRTHSARLLGLDIGRRYEEHGCNLAEEIPASLDLVYVMDGTLVVVDYKTGFGDHVESPAENKQLLFGAMCAAKHLGAEDIRIELWYVRPARIWKEGANVSMFDLRAFEDELHLKLKQLPVAAPRAGAHCKYCKARGSCPETQEHLGQLAFDERMRWSAQIADRHHAAWMAERLPFLERSIEAIKNELKAYADTNGGIALSNGKVFRAVESRRSSLNMEAVKRELGERISEFQCVTTVRSYRQVKA